MQGLFSTQRGAALYLVAWTMIGVLFTGLTISATGAAWGPALGVVMPVTLVYGCAAGFSSYYLCRAYPLASKSTGAIMTVFGFAAAIVGALWLLLCVAWNSLWPQAGITPGGAMNYSVFGLGVIIYWLLAVAHYLAIEFDKARAAERRELQSQLTAQEAQLRMLRTQIDPHFLFNSLNSISALTSISPVRARDMTLQLADFFRHTLGLEAHRKVTLDAEVRLLTHFVAIEKVRFGARLTFSSDIDDDAGACLLPPMILQPLVENAVKHGIGSLPEGGTVRVRAHRAGSILHITVDNDVDADMARQPGKGIGLVNVRERLATLYGHQASVHWERGGNNFRVALALPAETTEQTCE
ncbi:histidine kinase [Massilia sp. PAMC28688]|uniref:sensor histidine kinase n=1 Tax=Massilia sp. PAMC28688 TaxID=2861283 RepID=UPI001C63A9B3|nr:histidine kinase [Massilia sp. PAMC28688]QYF93505.1 histidine kinase [Massilia sp. PAMC28688]